MVMGQIFHPMTYFIKKEEKMKADYKMEAKRGSVKPSSDDRVAELEAMVEKLQGMVEALSQNSDVVATAEDNEVNSDKIQQDDYIPVMSLLNYPLILSTKQMGQGNVKRFSRFGEIKRILYRDLVDIMEVNGSFMRSGFFYIMDKRVIREHGLDDVYETILDKDRIDAILNTESEKVFSFYDSANERQQKVIVDLLIEKARQEPDSLNLNIIDRLSRVSGTDILRRAKELNAREEELMKETEE